MDLNDEEFLCNQLREIAVLLDTCDVEQLKKKETEISKLIKLVGHLNPDIRDGLCYEVLGRWFREPKIFSDLTRLMVFKELISDNYLHYRNDDASDASALQRSFSVLLLTSVISGDEAGILSPDLIESVVNKVCCSILQEKNVTKKHPVLGWVHFHSHAGVFLRFASSHRYCNDDLRLLMAHTAIGFLHNHEGFALAGEDDVFGCLIADALLESKDGLPVQTVVFENFKEAKHPRFLLNSGLKLAYFQIAMSDTEKQEEFHSFFKKLFE